MSLYPRPVNLLDDYCTLKKVFIEAIETATIGNVYEVHQVTIQSCTR
jgi:hypothetical protein